ncbi:perlucin-like protein [Glandiceps talaboti]
MSMGMRMILQSILFITLAVIFSEAITEFETEGECLLPDASICVCMKYQVFCEQGDPYPGLTYQESAAVMCKALGGRLANLKNAEIDSLVLNLIQDNDLDQEPCIEHYGFMFGLEDRNQEGEYIWSDGTPLVQQCNYYTNWAPKEPNNKDKKDVEGQDCVQFWFRGNRQSWDDEYCNFRPKGYICEIPKLEIVNSRSVTFLLASYQVQKSRFHPTRVFFWEETIMI